MAPNGSLSPNDTPSKSSYLKRSRAGCWTCKSLHKKCDEQRPSCGRCTRFKRQCEGYDVRVTWVGADRVQKGAFRRSKKTSIAASDVNPVDESPEPTPVSPPRPSVDAHNGVDWRFLQAAIDQTPDHLPIRSSASSGPSVFEGHIPEVVDDASEAAILTEFQTHGYVTMCRSLRRSPMLDKIVPLSWQSRAVARACLAYQAYVNQKYRYQFPRFLEEALELFKRQLQNNDVQADEVLVTGLLLCSVSISAALLWTVHLQGLEIIITERGHHDPSLPRDDLTHFLVEGVGLLDLPGLTIGRRNSIRHIWQRSVTPKKRVGIEPTTGLPRSLIDLMARTGSPEIESELLLWTPSEQVEHIVQYHFWEAHRLATILTARSLRQPPKPSADNSSTHNYSMPPDTEGLVMRIRSCIHSLRDAEEDPFRIPLYLCILWPLFVAALHTDKGSSSGSLLLKDVEAFVRKRDLLVDRLAHAILLEVWTRRDLNPELLPHHVAEAFAHEMGVELHLY